MNSEQLVRAVELVNNAKRTVVLTGAGLSRPSGIPDFRSANGLWANVNPFEVASLHAFQRDPRTFYSWLRSLLNPILVAQPNPAHMAIAQLEARGSVSALITQNIDGLHQRAGSRRVFELHGHLRSLTCLGCGRQVPVAPFLPAIHNGQVPNCHCGGVFKPDVILFDEMLPQGLIWLAQKALEECDLLIVAGTSLEVAPVSDLPLLALRRGARLLLVNLEPTYLDDQADVVLHDDVAVALPAIMQRAYRAAYN